MKDISAERINPMTIYDVDKVQLYRFRMLVPTAKYILILLHFVCERIGAGEGKLGSALRTSV